MTTQGRIDSEGVRSTRSNLTLLEAGLVVAIGIASAISPTARAADDAGWQWMVEPYGWLPSISTDLERTRPPDGGNSTDTRFDDLVDKIDGVFLVHAEGQNEHWGVFTDFIYLGLADSHDRPRFHTATDLDMRLFELAAVWSPGEGRYRGLEVFAGLRYIDVDLTAQLVPQNPAFNTTSIDAGDAFSDLMIGMRYTWALSERWGLTLRGDGSLGETEGTWNTSAVASYRMKRGAWLFGYRYLSIDLQTRDSKTDIAFHGPMLGYAFVF